MTRLMSQSQRNMSIEYLDYLLDNVLIIFKEEQVPILHETVKLCHVLTRLQLLDQRFTVIK